MGSELIEATDAQKDLGIIIHISLQSKYQVAKCVKTANKMLGMIRRTYADKSKENMLPLYKSLVRTHLDYGVQAWRPYHQRDIDILEGVQRRFLKMIEGYGDLTYDERLLKCGKMSLEMRRLRGDMIEVFKLLNGFVDVDYNRYFTLDKSGHRGRPLKLKVEHARLDVRKYFFTNRVIREWSALPRNVVMAVNIDRFKSEIDKILMKRRGNFISPKGLPLPVVESIVSTYRTNILCNTFILFK